jgi:signal transduction protein with GAF and PtsI domain
MADEGNYLVSAAQKMGQALVPSDTSKMFQEQFRALGKMHKAKMEGLKTGVKVGSKIAQKSIDEKNAKEAGNEEIALEKTDLTKAMEEDNSKKSDVIGTDINKYEPTASRFGGIKSNMIKMEDLTQLTE